MASKYDAGLTILLLQGLLEPEVYGDLVYKFRKHVGNSELSGHFSKTVVRYKRKRYIINVIKESSCLEANPIKVDLFAYLFNCTLVGSGFNSMMAPT